MLHNRQTAVFELREAFTRGVMDYAVAGTFYDNGWGTGVQCTYIYAEQAHRHHRFHGSPILA